MTGSYAGRAEWLVDRFKTNPEGLLLVAAGCALLLRAGSAKRTKDFMARPSAAASELGKQTADYARKVSETASDYASQAASYATSAAENFKDESARVVEQVHTQVSNTMGQVSNTMGNVAQRQPLVIAVAGLLAGAAIATAFPPTDIERRTVGPLGEELKDVTSELANRVSEGAQAASDRLKQTASERGLNADGVKQVASELAQAFTGPISEKSVPAGAERNAGPSAPGKTSIQ